MEIVRFWGMIRCMKKTPSAFAIVFTLGVFTGLIARPYLPASVSNPLPQAKPSPFPTESIASPSANVQGAASQTAKIIEVIDGDTVALDSGEHVRYIGIDTPETKHPRKGIECFGKKASDKNAELLLGKTVRLEKDVSERDRYDRLLRLVYLPTEQGELFINDYLVRQGYARAVTFPPDVTYADRFREAQKEAQANNRGLWSECQ